MMRWLRAVAGAVSRAAAAVLILGVRAYQHSLGLLLGGHCRYIPSCSEYAVEALRVHGPLRGTALAVWRILRCHPYASSGYDPVPPGRKHGCTKRSRGTR
jgi:hypothetical protein